MTRTFAMCGLVAITAIASAQTVTLRFKPPVGKSFTYATKMVTGTSGGPGGNMGMTQSATSVLKILSRTGDVTKVSSSTSNVKITVPEGSPLKAQVPAIEKASAQSMTMSISSLGVISGVSSKGGNPMNRLSGEAAAALGPYMAMPKNPVGVGSTWTTSFDLSKMFGQAAPGMKLTGGKIPLTLKLVKFVTKGTRKLAQVDTTGSGTATMSMSNGGQSMKMTLALTIKTSMLIDVATGVPASMTSKLTNKMNMGGQGSMTQTMDMTMTAK